MFSFKIKKTNKTTEIEKRQTMNALADRFDASVRKIVETVSSVLSRSITAPSSSAAGAAYRGRARLAHVHWREESRRRGAQPRPGRHSGEVRRSRVRGCEEAAVSLPISPTNNGLWLLCSR